MRFYIGHTEQAGQIGIVFCSTISNTITVTIDGIRDIGDLTDNEEFIIYAQLGKHSKWFPCSILADGIIDIDFNGFEVYAA